MRWMNERAHSVIERRTRMHSIGEVHIMKQFAIASFGLFLLIGCGGRVILPEGTDQSGNAVGGTSGDVQPGVSSGRTLFTSTGTMAFAALASDEDALYLCNAGVTRVPKDGSAPTTLTVDTDPMPGCGRGIVAADGAVSWICGGLDPDGGTGICRWASGWSAPKKIVDARPSIRAIAHYGGYLYWLEGDSARQIVRARTDGNDLSVLVPGGNFDVAMNSGRIAADDSGVYWLGRGVGPLAGGSLFRIAHGGGSIEVLDSATAGERGIALSSTEIAYVADGELRIVTKADGKVRTLRSVPTSQGYFFSRGISADASDVFIAINANSGNQLLRVPRAGGAPSVVSEHPAMDFILDVLVDADGVYEFGAGKLVAWPK